MSSLLTWPHTFGEFDHEQILQSLSQIVIIFYLFLVCRQRCNKYLNISSEILVCRPGFNPLGGLRGGRWPKINFSPYGLCSNMVANSLPEGTTSTLALSNIKSRPRYSSSPREFLLIRTEFCWYKKGCCQFQA